MTGQFLKKYNLENLSPAGQIHWASSNSIYYISLNHRNWDRLDLLTGNITHIFKDAKKGWRFDLMLSPDGKHLAFHGNFTDISSQFYGTFAIPINNHELKENDILYNPKNEYYHFGWSHDNQSLYVSSYGGDEYHRKKICKVSRKTWKIDKTLAKLKFKGSIVGINQKEDFIILKINETSESDIWLINNFDSTFNN